MSNRENASVMVEVAVAEYDKIVEAIDTVANYLGDRGEHTKYRIDGLRETAALCLADEIRRVRG